MVEELVSSGASLGPEVQPSFHEIACMVLKVSVRGGGQKILIRERIFQGMLTSEPCRSPLACPGLWLSK